MKKIFIIFAIALLSSGLALQTDDVPFQSVFLGKSTTTQQVVDVSEAQNNPDIKAHLDFGVQRLLQILLGQGKISSTNFDTKKVNSITKQNSGKALNYNFDVVLSDGQGTSITATFGIQYKPTGERTFGTYTYSMTKKVITTKSTTADDNAWIAVSLGEYQGSTEMRAALQYAIENSISQASKKGELAADTYDIAKVNSVFKQTVNEYNFYKFDIDLTNKKGTAITLTCQVAINKKNSQYTLQFYRYVATTTLYAERIKIVNTNDGFTQVSSSDLASSTEVQTVQNYGVQQIINLIISEGKITVTDFRLTQVTNCYRRVVGLYVFYKFEVVLTNSQGVVVNASFTVSYTSETGACALTGFTYNITGVQSVDGDATDQGQYIVVDNSESESDADTNKALNSGVNQVLGKAVQSGKISSDNTFKIKTVTSIFKKILSSGTYYKFSCVLEDDEGATMTLSFTVRYIVQTGVTTLAAYSYNVVQVSTEPGKFTTVDASQITNDKQAQTAIQYAVNQIVSKVNQRNALTSLDFKISQYNSVEVSITKAYAFYRLSVVLTNGIGGTITTTFTVRLHIKSGACELTAFTYNYSFKKQTTSTDSSDYEEADSGDTGDYVTISNDSITTDADVKLSSDYGVGLIIQKIAAKKSFDNTNFKISKVISIKKSVSGQWISCIFVLELTNYEGWTISVTFTVRCNTSTKACSLKSYDYKYTYDGNWINSLTYTDYDVSKASSDSQVQTAVNYGMNQIVAKYADKAKVSTGLNFSVSKYNSIKRSITASYVFYIFDVVFTNKNGVTINATFSIKLTIKTGGCELTQYSYTYTVQKISSADESDFTDADEEDGTYVSVDVGQITSNSDVKAAANAGINVITQKVATKQNIKSTGFTISKTNSIKKKTTLKWIYYQFDLVLTNGEGWTISATFTIRYNSKTGSNDLKSYHYKISYTEPPVQTMTESDVNKNDEAKAAMEWGVNQVQSKLKTQGVISALNFKVSKVNQGSVKRSKAGNSYVFDLEISNIDNFIVKISITVFVDAKTSDKTLTTWNLKGTANAVSAAASAAERAKNSIVSTISSWFKI